MSDINDNTTSFHNDQLESSNSNLPGLIENFRYLSHEDDLDESSLKSFRLDDFDTEDGLIHDDLVEVFQVTPDEDHERTLEEQKDEDEAQWEQQQLNGFILSSSRNNYSPSIVEKMIYTHLVPDFPESTLTGTGYLIDCSSHSENDMAKLYTHIQYSLRTVNRFKTTSSFLNNTTGQKTIYSCSGVQQCQYLDSELASYRGPGDESFWQRSEEIRSKERDVTEERMAAAKFRAIQRAFANGSSCRDWGTRCRSSYFEQPDSSWIGAKKAFIRCTRQSRKHPGGHFFESLNMQFASQFDIFKRSIRDQVSCWVVDDFGCSEIIRRANRRNTCRQDHVEGPGQLKIVDCQVRWEIFIPNDFVRYPYLLLGSWGEHTHPPPIPERVPEQHIKELALIVYQQNLTSLSNASLLKNPMIQDLCKQYNGKTLADIHHSLNNLKKIEQLLLRRTIGSCVGNQPLVVVEALWARRIREGKDEYLQDLHWNGEYFTLIVFFETQIRVLQQYRGFEIDMSFKRIKGTEFQELELALFDERQRKNMIFARIYVNSQSTMAYYQAFERFFTLCERKFNMPNKWHHIHGNNQPQADHWIVIILDQDSKQLSGLCKYLSDKVDPKHRPWDWHAQRCVIFCRVHLRRSINKLAFPGTEIYKNMMALVDASDMEQYQFQCQLLESHPASTKAIKAWVQHKRQIVIAYGICQAISHIPSTIWNKFQLHTNAVESTHLISYALGTKLPLPEAIQYGEIVDRRCMQQYEASKRGIQHTQQLRSMQQRFQDGISRRTYKLKQASVELTLQQLYNFSLIIIKDKSEKLLENLVLLLYYQSW